VFVFTPKGDVIALPSGANVIDFAYAIHSAVGDKMIGGKINGMIVPIDRTLENGEIVEILTSNSSRGPSRDWLNIVKTSAARSKIRAWFKKEKRTDNIQVGKATVEAELKKISKSFTEAQRDQVVSAVGARMGFNSAEDLYNAIGYGGVSMVKVTRRLQEESADIIKPDVVEPIAPSEPEKIVTSSKPRNIKSNSGIIVDGEAGCMVKFARCCNPLPGDSVIGFVTKGYGISIHKIDCPNVVQGRKLPENADRWKEAHWEGNEARGENQSIYEALLQIHADNRIGMLADISTALADMRVSILQINVAYKNDGSSIINMMVGCRNIDHFNSICSRLRSLNGVNNILRGFS